RDTANRGGGTAPAAVRPGVLLATAPVRSWRGGRGTGPGPAVGPRANPCKRTDPMPGSRAEDSGIAGGEADRRGVRPIGRTARPKMVATRRLGRLGTPPRQVPARTPRPTARGRHGWRGFRASRSASQTSWLQAKRAPAGPAVGLSYRTGTDARTRRTRLALLQIPQRGLRQESVAEWPPAARGKRGPFRPVSREGARLRASGVAGYCRLGHTAETHPSPATR